MKKRFIVLIDFSPYSKDQLLLAYKWSLAINADLLLVHTITIHKPALADKNIKKEIEYVESRESLALLKEFTRETVGETNNIDFQVSSANLISVLQQLISKENNDLIFAGMKGTGILKKIFIGSTVIDIINHINFPLVAVPKDLSNFSPNTFFVAINKKFPLNTSGFEYVLNLLRNLVNKVEFFTILSDPEEDEETTQYLKTLVDKYNPIINATYTVFKGENANLEIKALMDKQEDGILIVQRGTRSLSDQIFRKFLINELVYDAHTPLIVLPE